MKKGITVNIGNYQSLKYESSEFNTGSDDCNILECNKEILKMLEKDFKMFPELEFMINKFKKLIE